MRQATLCLLINDKKILLAMKKRGFGVGRWNGTGGKVREGESVFEAAVRETKEEIGIELKNSEKAGLFHFRFPHKPEYDQDVHLFLAKEWAGEPVESEEMAPKWFDFDKIPYEKMWDDDKIWLPLVLKGEKLEADFIFDKEDKIKKFEIKTI